MSVIADIGWGRYRQYEGPFYRGEHRFVLPEDHQRHDRILAVTTATEGGRYDAINMYDEAAPEGRLPEPEYADDAQRAEEEDEREERDEAQGLDADLAEEVMNLVEDQETDLTRTILVAVEDPEAGSMKTHLRLGSARMAMQPDPLLVKQLKRIFNEQESLVRRARRRRT